MKQPPYLILDGLSAQFGTTLAVDAVTLEVGKGELVALLGPSGCGKTTTLRMVAGFVAPSAGRVQVNGKDITALAAHRRNMGVVFQSYALFPHMDILRNVAFGLRMRGIGQAECQRKAGAALEMVALSRLANRYPSQLSGGQQQRVALARALVIEPDVLLLDEPLSNLDANLRVEMRGEIRRLQQRLAITTLFVTHDQEEALAMSDRIAVMQQGKLIEVGTPQALCDHPQEAFTASFLGARSVIAGRSSNGIFEAPGLGCADAPAGAKAIILRAARLRLSETPNGPLRLGGVVTSAIYLGDDYEVEVETPAGLVRVLSPSDMPPPAIGRACQITALAGGYSFLS
ncbi:MAG: ABC transporter ATP-binding protein [Roseomonas sp.]|nr:ABC transporter ATP-binding protein [Roseomonas sp.]MCA3330347.1 ABC transporter ATP-binding protein [Roseomonas sp.]MCA3335202.1 ABC transporter ATP-binding protein [Roseomonas sp.]MCA3347675.1 ABC transporter ATP-binding protein [Roseomonas sp.]MCA3355351.1 ABC transporter ATP-binding protein [Roseomonas sp.]